MPTDRHTADAQALFDRGHQSFQDRDYREAVECFTRAIALRPDVAAGYRSRAMAYLGLGQRTDALNDLDRAVRLKPDDPALYADRADVLFKQKSYPAAIADCDKVLALDPAWAPVRGLRGECHAAAGDTAKALADFAAAIEADPNHAADYLLARANLHLSLEDYPACVDDCTTAVRLAPDNPAGYQTRGLALRELKDFEAAEDDFSAVVRLAPDAALARLGRATVRLDLARYAEAAEDCDAAVRASAGNPRAYSLRGLCRRHLGDLAGAVADFTESIRQSPQAPLGYNLRAAARYQLGEYRTAIQDHLEALKRDPRDPGTFNQLAWIWATAPDPDVRNGERAKECATRACELTEWQEAGYLDTLAAACAECGEHDVAVQWQQKALDRARPEQMAEYTARLVLYVDGKPYRARPGQSDS